MALFWRIWMAVVAVNLVVLSIFVILATMQFGNINAGLAADRLIVLANRTAAPFEAAAKLGLSLSTVRNARALLERSKQSDEAILSIDVFDADGRIIHSTAESPLREIPAGAQATRRAARGHSWHHETSVGFLSSIEISSRDGGSAGGIMITYSNTGNVTRLHAVGAELALGAFLIFLVTSGLSAGLLRLGLNPQIGFFESIEKTISDFERAAWRSSGRNLVPAGNTDENELMDLLVKAEHNYRKAKHALDGNTEQAE
jgi:hypothetical protein